MVWIESVVVRVRFFFYAFSSLPLTAYVGLKYMPFVSCVRKTSILMATNNVISSSRMLFSNYLSSLFLPLFMK